VSQPGSDQNQRIFLAPAPVVFLVIVLLGLHGLIALAGEDWQNWIFYVAAFNPARYSAASIPMVPGSEIWSFLTYAFLHGSWSHVIFNCAWLLAFGTPVARHLGTWRFLLLQAVAAIAGAAVMLLSHWGEDTIVIGASAAVTGLLAAAVPIMYGHKSNEGGVQIVPLRLGELLRNGKAMGFIAVLLVIMSATGIAGFTGSGFIDGASIAWEAHLAGFAAGLAAFYVLGAERKDA
jgi:membrane associated rhomboid family serine protease